MNKKNITFLIGTIASLILLGLLYYNFSSNRSREDYLKNGGFNRSELSAKLTLDSDYDLDEGYYGIVGLVGDKILIREYDKSSLLLLSEGNLKETVLLPDTIDGKDVFYISMNPFKDHHIDVQSNNSNKIFEFDIDRQKIVSSYHFKKYFYKAIRASADSFYSLVQNDDMEKVGLALIKFDKSGNSSNIQNGKFNIDAMSEDGSLIKTALGLVYINYYNNQISVIDSTLTDILPYNTIDTITELPKTINIKNNTITKFIKQPRPVNQLVRASKNYLFINSYVKADNESEVNPDNSETLDVYEIHNKYKYKGTIYLKRHDGNRVQDFLIENNRLIVQYPNKTLSYELSL